MSKVHAESKVPRTKILNAIKPPFEKSSAVFKDWLKDYLKNSSVAGCVYYVSRGKRLKDRLFWITVHIICVIFLAFMIFIVTSEYRKSPTVITPETNDYPIQNIDFPGVAICYVNKINYTMAVKFAEDILSYDYVGNITHAELMNMLKYLGHLYLFELHDSEKETINLLHSLLVRRYGHYVLRMMKQLSPDIDCQFMLQYCSWGGNERICENLFIGRISADGICCMFNYARRNDAFGKNQINSESLESFEPLYATKVGARFGLTVLLRPDYNTHYYKILSTRGYKILIFPPFDFSDAASGGLREVLVAPRTETSLSLDAVSLYSDPAVSRFDVAQRGCLFKDELSLIFDGYYSYSDCIMYCRIADIGRLCQCTPFFYPTNEESPRFCDLRDLPCLNKYRERWMRMNPSIEQRTRQFSPDDSIDGLNCTECFPACADVSYKVSVSSAPLSAATARMGRGTFVLSDQSIVHVFFSNPGIVRLKQHVLYDWYDLMSNCGGICSLFLGISFISVAEFLYFFTVRLYVKKKNFNREKILRFAIVEAKGSTLPPLYWNEFSHTDYYKSQS